MAIYHCQVSTIGRSKGRSATAAAAYRSGDWIKDKRTGEIHDYSKKKGVEYTEIFLTEKSPKELYNRSKLWNEVEASETRKNSMVAREVEVGLPHELDRENQIRLVRIFSKKLRDEFKVGVDACIHKPHRKGDERNYHAHIMITTRRMDERGISKDHEKTREFHGKEGRKTIEWIRSEWAKMLNLSLEREGISEKLDHRSYKRQGVEQLPTVHVGVHVTAMERRGIETERGDVNRQIRLLNKDREEFIITPKEREVIEKYSAEYERCKRDIDRKEQNLLSELHEKWEGKKKQLKTHREKQPTEPKGLFSVFKQRKYKEDYELWKKIDDDLEKEKRWSRIDYERTKEDVENSFLLCRRVKDKLRKNRPELVEANGKIQEKEKELRVMASREKDIIREKERKKERGREIDDDFEIGF